MKKRRANDGRLRRPKLKYRLHTSFGTLLCALGALLIALIAMDSDANLLMIVFGLCFGAILLNLMLGWWSIRSLHVTRELPDLLIAGQPSTIRYVIRHTGRWGWSRSVKVTDGVSDEERLPMPETYIRLLGPGASITLDVPVFPLRRGRVQLTSIRCGTRYPFGIVGKSVTAAVEQEVIVLPALARLKTELKMDVWAADGSSGDGISAHVRGDDEFYGVREYRVGDNPRRIHWRRSARTGQLMIREMAKTRDPQLWCVVNTRIDERDPQQIENLETVISCAATVICDVLERGSKVGLLCNGEPLLMLPPAGGRLHRPRLLRELALRTSNTEHALTAAIASLSWPARWRGACLLFAAKPDDDLRDAERLLNQVVGPTTIFVPKTPAFDRVFHPPGVVRMEEAGGLMHADVIQQFRRLLRGRAG